MDAGDGMMAAVVPKRPKDAIRVTTLNDQSMLPKLHFWKLCLVICGMDLSCKLDMRMI